MRFDAPQTPGFDAELERRLVREAARRRRIRMPARLSSLRKLGEVNRLALHAALASGIAAALLLVSPATLEHEAPLAPDLAASLTPAYLTQYGGVNVETTIATARERGYEVQLVRSYTPNAEDHRRILSIRHAGSELDDVPEKGARGPLLIVMGLAIGDRSSTAD